MFPGAGVPSSSPLGLTASGTHPNEAGARCVQCPPHGADVAGEVSAPWPCSCGCCPVVTGELAAEKPCTSNWESSLVLLQMLVLALNLSGMEQKGEKAELERLKSS